MAFPAMAARRSCAILLRLHPRTAILALNFLFAHALLTVAISAQILQSSADQNTIRGTVVNAVTHMPLPRALVHSADDRYAMMSDGDGHFEFTVRPGTSVYLLARKPGFLGDRHTGRAIQTSPGDDVTIPLTPESVIKGRVSTSSGETPAGVEVQLLAHETRDGMARWSPTANAQSRSDGSFRFADLAAGSYKIMTHEFMDNDPAVAVPGAQRFGFPPAYFPAASDFSAAGTIDLAAGQTLEANLTITEQLYYPVKIPLANGEMNGGLDIRVNLEGRRGPGYSLGYNASTHRIEGSLPNGNYTVLAFTYAQDSVSGEVNLRVAGAPAEGPPLTLTRNSSLTLEVQEVFTQTNGIFAANGGTSQRPYVVRGPQAYLYPRLEPADDFAPWGTGSVRSPSNPNDTSIVIDNIVPGRYWLRLNTGQGYVASATMGGINLLHEPFEVGSGSSIPIEITLRDDSATLQGTVANASPSTFVYCVPLGDSPGQFHEGAAAADGKFNFPPLAPGTYRVMAFASQKHDLPYRDSEAMRAYDSKGQVIQLSAGQSASVQLQIIPDD
jgi:hypothetical protein